MVYPLDYMDKASQSRQCPYCAEPFEPRYLYTSGGCGIFITQTKKIKRPVVSISKGMLEDLNLLWKYWQVRISQDLVNQQFQFYIVLNVKS